MDFVNLNNNFDEVEKWQNSENSRLENIGYCNKITNCLSNLDTHQDEIRAIWELMQNARDLALEKSGHVEIKLTKDCFIFSHHGIPFDYTSLRSLVKQDSSKDRKDEAVAGQYGTGFMTTHIFNKVVKISAPYEVKDDKQTFGYVQIKNFELNREHVDDPELGPKEMASQLKMVSELAKQQPKKELENDVTSFEYKLTPDKAQVLSKRLDSIINLLPFVLTINSNIKQVEVTDELTHRQIIVNNTYSHSQENFGYMDWKVCKDCIELIDKSLNKKENYCCCSLQSNDSGEIVIIPPYPTNCKDIKNIPSLFLWFPLLGTENFGVNFIFHSKHFFPVETRDSIVLPNRVDSKKQGAENGKIINKMTDALLAYYGNNQNSRLLDREMCEVTFPVNCDDEVTNDFFKSLREKWVKAIPDWEIIPIGNEKKSMSDVSVKLLHEDFFKRLTAEQKVQYSPLLRKYATLVRKIDGQSYNMPSSTDLITWSETVSNWKCEENEKDFFITIDDVCNCIKSKNDDLYDFLTVLIDCNDINILNEYSLVPNRDGDLCLLSGLVSADFSNDVYNVVKNLMIKEDRNKIVDGDFSEIGGHKFPSYTIDDLSRSINITISEWKNKSLKSSSDLSEDQIDELIRFCSSSSNYDAFSKKLRFRMMEILPRFYDKNFKFVYLPLHVDETNFYQSAYDFLIEYTSYRINNNDSVWVKDNIRWLKSFISELRPSTNKDRAELLDKYKLIPNQLDELCTKNELKINKHVPIDMNEMFIKLYGKEEDLRKTWIKDEFIEILGTEQFKETNPEEIAYKIQEELVRKMEEDVPEQKYTDMVQTIIDKICDDKNGKDWGKWFKTINDRKEIYTFRLIKDSRVRKSLFTIMKWDSQHLELLNNLNKIESSTMNTLFSLLSNENFGTILDEVKKQIEQEIEKKISFGHLKSIGEYIEKKLKEKIGSEISATVDDVQNGQDIIVRLNGRDVYYIEVKSKLNFTEPAHMSNNQIKKAVLKKDKYALFCVDLRDLKNVNTNFDALTIDDIVPRTKVKDKIGETLFNLMKNIIEADDQAENDETKMTINWFGNNIKAKDFTDGITLDEFLENLEKYIQEIK